MNVLVLLFFVFFLPLVALLAGTTINPRHGAYGRTYARNIPYPGAAGSEAIEMEDMMQHDKWELNDSDDET
ncbi:unnamed protein product [Aureobasidium vineae]|uniref:Uncharacterized protein n=1 Tax=Aureobasidium vineae TaxID=2773715 RepID=A0A9N8JB61_9PEZI|nr:unnamed protein product [Aureobasidium vineae]